MDDQVECHSGYEYAERPTALYWQGLRLQVAEILVCQRIPEGKFFRVKTQDDRVFELFYAEWDDEWHIDEG